MAWKTLKKGYDQKMESGTEIGIKYPKETQRLFLFPGADSRGSLNIEHKEGLIN